jgi:CheY-like chemotaxis protein
MPGARAGLAACWACAARAAPPVRRAARRMLVVDNEEADRELLVQLLEPLGFELRTAASGHDCLDLLAAGYQPDAILMDLAMPGIDGWETIRRCARSRVPPQPCAGMAIVSANAFDKGWTTTWASAPKTSSSSPCATASCWTGWSAAGLQWLDRPRPPARSRAEPDHRHAQAGPAAQQLAPCGEVVAWVTTAAS